MKTAFVILLITIVGVVLIVAINLPSAEPQNTANNANPDSSLSRIPPPISSSSPPAGFRGPNAPPEGIKDPSSPPPY